jgi:signal transduction histidine kinase
MAAAAIRTLQGASDVNQQLQVTTFSAPVYDWRELNRWHADVAQLPPGSTVRYKPPSLLDEHLTAIIVVGTALLVQAMLIAALLWQRTGRRRAEREAQSLGGRLITAHEDERRRLARDLHDDVTQRLAGLAIDAAMISGSEPGVSRQAALQIRDSLVDLSEDIHALSHQLHPSIIEDLGLVEALRAECDRVSRQETIRVDLDADPIPAKLPADKAICLFRVAQEALRNVVRHAGASTIDVSLQRKDGGIALGVLDNGNGFDDSHKHARASLGLASMRERVRLQAGRIDIKSSVGRGTAVLAWIPLQEQS